MSLRALLTSVVAVIIFTPTIEQIISYNVRFWRYDRRPVLICDKYSLDALMPNRTAVQKKILMYHNHFRSSVVPKAANMLKMKWHAGASELAQNWSEKCVLLTHDNATDRTVPNYGLCGQNIFVSTRKVPWLFAIKTWYLEKQNFTYGGSKNNLTVIGHYTQMVWASSHEIGCGLAKCQRNATGKTYYNYICNYCPIGNRSAKLGRPYRAGKPCGLCRGDCYANRLCTNACRMADFWGNCRLLFALWPHWLCNTMDTVKGRERSMNCMATCRCKNKIHD